MFNFNSNITSDTINEILSLRYATNQDLVFSKLTPTNFLSNNNSPSSEKIEQLLQNYIVNTIPKSSKISIALSGGVDSTIVLAMLDKVDLDLEIDALSIKFSNSVDETILASKIAERFNVNHRVIYLENYLEELPKAISITKLPFWDLHFYHVAKNAKYNFLISGDGGDELFGGYTFRYQKFLSLVDSKSTPQEKTEAYLKCHERDWVPDQENIFLDKMNFSWKHIHKKLIPYFDNSLPLLEQVFLADYNGKLMYNWAPLFAKITNFFNQQLITPILSPEITSYAIPIPHEHKYNFKNNVGKLLLRKILSNYVDTSLIQSVKQGFTVDTKNLWYSYGQKICKNYLIDGYVVKEKLINKDWIQKYIQNDNLEIKYINKFLGLLAFEIWFRIFEVKEMKSDNKLN
jgi:asparagine synthase (glutamine-hydrolysing)